MERTRTEAPTARWVKFDCEAFNHPKVIKAGPEAALFWARSIAYCNEYRTNGLLDRDVVPAAGGCVFSKTKSKKLAEKLADAGLFLRTETGYEIHDYEEFQAPAMRYADADVTPNVTDVTRDERDRARDRKRRERDRKRDMSRSVTRDSSSNSKPIRSGSPPNPPGGVTPDVTRDSADDGGVSNPPLSEFGGVYREVTGNEDLSADPTQWRTAHSARESGLKAQVPAVKEMRAWAKGDLEALRKELTRLKRSNRWLADQPVHVWAGRLGAGPAGDSLNRGQIEIGKPATTEQLESTQDDFDWLTAGEASPRST